MTTRLRHLARVELRDRRLLRERPALVLEPGGLVREQPSGVDLDGHVGELELHRLEVGDRPAELLPLLRVRDGEVEGALREADGHRGDGDAAAVEDLEELVEPLAASAEEVRLGHRAALERELPRVGCPPAHLLHRLRDDVAGGAVGDDDVRHLAVAGEGGDRHAGGDVGAGVRDEDLRAVDHPLAVAQLGARLRRACVGARSWLGEAEGCELPPGREIGQPRLLLLLGAEEEDRHRAERRVRGDGDAHGGVDSRELLDRDRVRDRVSARAAPFLRDGEAHEPEPGELLDELVGKAVLAVELLGDGRHALLRELAHGAPDELVLVGELEVHSLMRGARRAMRSGGRPSPCRRPGRGSRRATM